MKNRSLVKLIAVALVLLIAGLAPLPRRSIQLRVGSKKFTESVILGEMMRLLTEEAGLKVAHYREFGGTRIVFDALAAGEIDIYPEYTGTITAEIFAGQNASDEKTMRDLLHKKGIGMSKSLGFSDTYALAMTRRRAAQLGLSKISDLKRLPELQLALTHEFLDRGDGWTALERRYDLQQRNVVGVDHDVAYRQLLAGEVDIIDVYSTDAMIRRGDLALLKDDAAFFPRYDAVWLYRLEAASRYPELAAAMHRLDGTVSEATMQALNDEVEAGRKTETQAAADFLTQQLGLHVDVQTTSRTQMIATHILEHLDLVRRSLLPAIVVGIALGILCQRNPRTGRVVLAAVGLLQTIPSLALLVLLLPLVAALGLSQHRRRFGDGRDGPFLLLPVAHREEHLHGAGRDPARNDRIGHSFGAWPDGTARRDRAAHRLADAFSRHSHFGRAKRGLRDAGRHHRRRRIGPADSAWNPRQRHVADSGRRDPRGSVGPAFARIDRRARMGRGAARFEAPGRSP